MTFKMPETREEFLTLEPRQRADAIIHVLDESAERCRNNILTAGTWIENTFQQVANDLYHTVFELSLEIEVLKHRLKEKPKKSRRSTRS